MSAAIAKRARWNRRQRPGRAGEEPRGPARRSARLSRETLEFALVVGLLALLMRPLAWLVGLVWGLRLARAWSRHAAEPELRECKLQRRVDRELAKRAPAGRRAVAEEHTQRLAELSAAVAHELHDPIVAAKELVQQMGGEAAAEQNLAHVSGALRELDRVERSIAQLLRFARDEELRLETLWIDDLVDAAIASFDADPRRQGVLLQCDLEPTRPLQGDPEMLRRVLVDLFGHALDALREQPPATPRISVAAGENLAGSDVWLRLRHNGRGFDAAERESVFSPFRGSLQSRGGLGLAIARKLVDAHGGKLELQVQPAAGSDFLLTLPRHGVEETA